MMQTQPTEGRRPTPQRARRTRGVVVAATLPPEDVELLAAYGAEVGASTAWAVRLAVREFCKGIETGQAR